MLFFVSSLFLGCETEEEVVSFSNLPPFSPIVDLQPAVPYSNNDLEALIVAESVDPDNDPVTLSYVWYKNDEIQTDITDAVVSADLTSPGEIWTVEVFSNDGSLNSAGTRRSVTIRNSIPTASAYVTWVDDQGAAIVADSELTMDEHLGEHTDENIRVFAEASDIDADEISYVYEWEVDGVVLDLEEDTLAFAELSRGQDWIVRVTPNDGTADGDTLEIAFGIYNGIPVVDSVTITPETPVVGDTLTCSATGTDEEEDELTFSYTWQITNGENVTEESGEELDSTTFISGSSITCTVIANDGMDNSDSFTSDAITLGGNSMPMMESVTITPETAVVGDTLTCEGVGVDPDGDELTISYVWSNAAGEEIGTEATFDSTGLAAGDELTCTASANDGEWTSDTMSASITLAE